MRKSKVVILSQFGWFDAFLHAAEYLQTRWQERPDRWFTTIMETLSGFSRELLLPGCGLTPLGFEPVRFGGLSQEHEFPMV